MVLLYLQLVLFQSQGLDSVQWIEQWESNQYSLQYGRTSAGNLVLKAQCTKRTGSHPNLEKLVRIYLDDRLARVSSLEEIESWKEERALLIGSILNHRLRELPLYKVPPQSIGLKALQIENTLIQENPGLYVFGKDDSNLTPSNLSAAR